MKTFTMTGPKGAGRSHVLLSLIADLKRRGHRVGVVRHLRRDDLEIDQPGKDTYEYRMQGAEKVILSGRRRCAIFENREQELGVAELLSAFEGYDFLFLEEYFLSGLPMIEVQSEQSVIVRQEGGPLSFQGISALTDFLEHFDEVKEQVLPC